MPNDFLSEQQAAGVGGADNKAGATGENTFQNNKEKQLLVFIKPGKSDAGFGDSLSAAGGLISGVTSKIDSAVSAIEDVASNIPGLDLFIKEKKTESPSEKEYCTDFSAWESTSKEYEKKAKEILDENISIVFGFEASNEDEFRKEGNRLKDKILDKLSSWKDYTAWVHLIGVDTGGLVMNECSQQLATDSTFLQEKWMVRSAFSVGTPSYQNKHQFHLASLKGQGKQIQVFNKFDLTQQVISFTNPSADLVKYITNCNSNLIKITIAKLKMRVIRIIASLLKGVTIGTGAGVVDPIKKLVNDLQNEIKGLIEDITSMIDEIIEGIKELIDLSELPDVQQFTKGFDQIPDECKKILSSELSDLIDKIEKGAKTANLEVGLSDLTKFLNCLCPLVDHLTGILKSMSLNPTSQTKLAEALLKKVNIQQIAKPGLAKGVLIDLSAADPYTQKVNDAVKEKKPDQASLYISALKSSIVKASQKTPELNNMSPEDRQQVADLVFRLTYPMLTSKKELIEKLMHFITGLIDLKEMMNDITLQSLAAAAGDKLKVLYLSFPPEKLAGSIQQFDSEFGKVKDFFTKRGYDMKADTLYLMYNSHNLVIKSISEHMSFELDTQIGYANLMNQKGYANRFVSSGKNEYEKVSDREIKNVLPTKELPETNNA